MSTRDISTVTVLGAGSMGHGIAEVCAIAGYEVRLRDIEQEVVDNGYEQITWSVEKLAEKGYLGEQTPEDVLERLEPLVDLDEAVNGTDLVIEAVPERMEIKQDVYEQIDRLAPSDAIFASNTSSLSISDLASHTTRPEQVCGLHFFNPPVRMELVEVISGEETAPEIMDVAVDFVDSIDKTPIRVSKDSPGFVVNRILVPLINEATWLVSDGVADIQSVDASAKFDIGLPMGCFELADQIGVDVILDVVDHLHDVLGEAYEPGPRLVTQVESGEYGKKTGSGFYDYEGDGVTIPPDGGINEAERRLVAVMANEAAKLIENEVSTVETIDQAVTLGGGFPKGPAKLADKYGVEELVETLDKAERESGHPRYEVTAELREIASTGGFYTESDGLDLLEIDYPAEYVGRITIDRPNQLNTLNLAVLDQLETAIDMVFDQDKDVRVLLLTGRGDRAFSAGAEVHSVVGDDSSVEAIAVSRKGQQVFDKLETTDVPVIAAINGFCLGGGMELSMAADIRIASDQATFGLPEHTLGLLPGWGGTQRLQWLIGESRAKEIIFTAETFDADTMQEYGLVIEVVEQSDLENRVLELAKLLSTRAPVAQKLTKEAMRAGRHDATTGFDMEAYAFGHLLSTDDLTEGIAAFSNDRDPEFDGK